MLTIALPLLLAAAPATAPAAASFGPADIADGQCVAAFGLLGNNKDTAQSATIGMVFFYGKLLGRTPAISLETLLRAVAADVKKDPGTYLKRCAGELQTSGDALTTAGKALAADGL